MQVLHRLLPAVKRDDLRIVGRETTHLPAAGGA